MLDKNINLMRGWDENEDEDEYQSIIEGIKKNTINKLELTNKFDVYQIEKILQLLKFNKSVIFLSLLHDPSLTNNISRFDTFGIFATTIADTLEANEHILSFTISDLNMTTSNLIHVLKALEVNKSIVHLNLDFSSRYYPRDLIKRDLPEFLYEIADTIEEKLPNYIDDITKDGARLPTRKTNILEDVHEPGSIFMQIVDTAEDEYKSRHNAIVIGIANLLKERKNIISIVLPYPSIAEHPYIVDILKENRSIINIIHRENCEGPFFIIELSADDLRKAQNNPIFSGLSKITLANKKLHEEHKRMLKNIMKYEDECNKLENQTNLDNNKIKNVLASIENISDKFTCDHLLTFRNLLICFFGQFNEPLEAHIRFHDRALKTIDNMLTNKVKKQLLTKRSDRSFTEDTDGVPTEFDYLSRLPIDIIEKTLNSLPAHDLATIGR